MQVAKMAEFYDRWKEKYLDIRLQPLVSLLELLQPSCGLPKNV